MKFADPKNDLAFKKIFGDELIPKEYENIEEFKMAFETAKIYNWKKRNRNC